MKLNRRIGFFTETIAAIIVILLAVSVLSPVAAEDTMEYRSLRGGEISLSLPQSWGIEELDTVSEDGSYEAIFRASDGDLQIELDYCITHDAEYIFLTSEDETQEYFDDYGKAALEKYYDEEYPDISVEFAEPVYFEGEWDHYMTVEVNLSETGSGSGQTQVAYLSGQTIDFDEANGLINRMFICGAAEGADELTAEEIRESTDPIVDDFYDYGYDEVMAGVSESTSDYGEAYDDNSGFDFSADWSIIIFAIIIVIFIAIRKRRKRNSSYEGAGQGRKSVSFKSQRSRQDAGMKSAARRNRRGDGSKGSGGNAAWKNVGADTSAWENAGAKASERKRPTDAFGRKNGGKNTGTRKAAAENRYAAPDDGYIASLETLRKSGLVTRKVKNE